MNTLKGNDIAMIYTPLTKKALVISFNAHKEQLDKSGMPYVYHPFHVAEQMKDEYTTCVALLHDVVEDTDTTLNDLHCAGFPDEVVDAVGLMTHPEGVPYFVYIEKIRSNPIATAVKLADLAHNMDVTRIDRPDEKFYKRLEKYKKAVLILNAEK